MTRCEDSDDGSRPSRSGTDLRKMFFQSMVATGPSTNDVPPSTDDRPDGNDDGKTIVDFTMESLLGFENEHLVHTAHVIPPAPPRKRPNYDSRNRKFLSNQVDRRRFLALCLVYFSCLFF